MHEVIDWFQNKLITNLLLFFNKETCFCNSIHVVLTEERFGDFHGGWNQGGTLAVKKKLKHFSQDLNFLSFFMVWKEGRCEYHHIYIEKKKLSSYLEDPGEILVLKVLGKKLSYKHYKCTSKGYKHSNFCCCKYSGRNKMSFQFAPENLKIVRKGSNILRGHTSVCP